ncbi:MAG: hypothetical protein KGI91_04025 [Burkholderiales bacterium]|nr:hypothetical protein [Burkholderiales bacterium]MDE2076229.1 hypothetical protein [Burkholderiales bacterium]MDE2431389.1 hypothetical protein [Burkholderiales bacterium]
MSPLSPRTRRIGLYLVLVLLLTVVFMMYFRAGLILDIANFIWRCA